MPIPSIDPLPEAPLRNDPDFSTKTAAWVLALANAFIPQINAFAAALVAEAQGVISGVASVNGETGILTGFAKALNQTMTNLTLAGWFKETVFTITDGASVDIDPANGTEQFWTLGANRTPTAANLANGQSITLYIADGTSYAVTWSSIGVVWAGGVAPVLPANGYAVIVLSKAGGVVRGFSAQDTTS